jgi:hypothetical protein
MEERGGRRGRRSAPQVQEAFKGLCALRLVVKGSMTTTAGLWESSGSASVVLRGISRERALRASIRNCVAARATLLSHRNCGPSPVLCRLGIPPARPFRTLRSLVPFLPWSRSVAPRPRRTESRSNCPQRPQAPRAGHLASSPHSRPMLPRPVSWRGAPLGRAFRRKGAGRGPRPGFPALPRLIRVPDSRPSRPLRHAGRRIVVDLPPFS